MAKLISADELYKRRGVFADDIGKHGWREAINNLPAAEPERTQDAIDRQAAIDAIHCDITITGRQNAELVSATIGAFADRIKALPSVQPEPKWIPCCERLPEKSGTAYLITFPDYNFYEDGRVLYVVDIFGYEDGKWVYDYEEDVEVIAWVPLPEPYKGEQE